MTTTSRRRPAAQPAGLAPRPTRTARDVLVGVGSLLALTALLAGLPIALALLVGWPLPRQVPTGAELLELARSPITDTLIVNALACVFWVAWLQLVVCTVLEARAAITGVGVPRAVPLAGVTQHLTRKLVSSVLLLVTATALLTPLTATVTRAALPDSTGWPAGISAAADAVAPVAAQAPPAFADQAPSPSATAPVALEEDRTRLAGDLAGRKVLVVEPPEGRHHMSLWEIAEEHLGDGLRYKEIFTLNDGRAQPDGGTLVKARLIQPGWQLLMPDDASGVATVPAAPIAPAPVQSPAEAPMQAPAIDETLGVAAAGGVTGGSVVEAGNDNAAGVDVQGNQDESVWVSVVALAQAGLLSAGLLAGLGRLRRVQQRRRSDGERLPRLPAELLRAEVEMRLGQDPEAVRDLDCSLRLLADTQSASLAALPDVVAVVVAPETVRLVLSAPTRPVPAPFTALDPLGGSWQALRSGLPNERPQMLSPYPALVGLGRDDDGGELLVDLESVGVLALSGPRRSTTAVLRALAVELATSGWADHLRLTVVGFGAELVQLQPERVRYLAGLAEALPTLEGRLAELSGHPDGPAAVLRSRTAGADPLMPELVLVAEQDAPDAALLARLQAVAAGLDRRCGLGLVTGEDVPSARWTMRLAADGTAVVQPLGAWLRTTGLDDQAWTAVTELVTLAAAPPVRRAAPEPMAAAGEPDALTPEVPRLPSLADVTARSISLPGVPASPVAAGLRLVPVEADSGRLVPRGVAGEVRVLGPVEVDVPGAGPAPHPHCVELAVLLALHPQGLTVREIAEALDRNDDPAAASRTAQVLIARTRSWLGSDDEGRERLPRTGTDEPLRLSPAMTLDWDRFQQLAAHDTTRAQALDLVRGPVLSALPARRYAWLVPTSLEADVASAVVDLAVRVVEQRLVEGDSGAARAAAEAGLRADHLDERLWRALLRAYAADGDLGRVAELADQLATLVDDELAPYDGLQPATVALVEELVPRTGPQTAAR